MAILSNNSKDKRYIRLGLKIMADFGATIAIPVIMFVLVGQWLDNKYGTRPWITIIAFLLAALVSGKMIYKKAREYGREYEEINK